MAAVDDSRTLGPARLSFASETEIDEFAATLAGFERGEVTPEAWRAFRLVRGTYGQRQADEAAHMLRVKIPQGVLDASQLQALADVAERHSRGFGHITTRQNLQFHFVKLQEMEAAMRRLAQAGLTTREACGNSVRNITACPYAGVAHDELFDVTPYAEQMTRHLLRHPLSSTLPRKFKIAFEGCSVDHVATAINDIGWRARLGPEGQPGFRVTVGGGTSILCTAGQILYEFLPAGEMLVVTEAILRVFHRFGDYQHKQRNRMKFLIRSLGWDRWRQEFEQMAATLRHIGEPQTDAQPPMPLCPARDQHVRPPSLTDVASRVTSGRIKGPGLTPVVVPLLDVSKAAAARWSSTNVRPQKQPGFVSVTAAVPLGDLTSAQMRVLADLASTFGDGTVRTTLSQNLLFRWVRSDAVRSFYDRLAAAGLGLAGAGTIVDVTSCPGAESCRLAVTESRGLGRMIEAHLRARPDLVQAAGDATIKISGCPNGCGQHHIATIGFQGSMRKVGEKLVPQYFVLVGGDTAEGEARFGRLAAKIPARRLGEAVDRLIVLYRSDRAEGESARAFFGRVALPRVRTVLEDLEHLTAETIQSADLVDLGAENEFRPEIMDGECSA